MTNLNPCPKCSSNDIEKMGFTWWGGFIGPRILSHVKCNSCGEQFNGKTGKSNTVGIIIYTVVVLGIVLAIAVVIIAAIIAAIAMN